MVQKLLNGVLFEKYILRCGLISKVMRHNFNTQIAEGNSA